jgi:glycosyltransferase involved in cell wall biosynthesis/GT2 family glycosyltransferase
MAVSVCVGVPVHAEPGCLVETLRMLRMHTSPAVPVVLLPDGPDEPTATALEHHGEFSAYRQWGTADPRGLPACLNRLAARSIADVLVLLESGALAGPRWLDLLLDALSRPGVGLTGPSTNRGWNEQAIFPHATGSRAGVRRTAAEAVSRYGRAARSLAPLYSLAEFCYVVRREVLEVTGGADEGYGPAPCWEMDLNVRAARAGFAGLWASGAYVYRSPPTARRAAEDEQLLDPGKRRYQDRFCGLRQSGPLFAYRAHCDGDACVHFAPTVSAPAVTAASAVIIAPAATGASAVLTGPAAAGVPAALATSAVPAATVPAASTSPAAPAARAPQPSPAPQQAPARARQLDRPTLVSCVMPTRDRFEFALQAVRYFQRQDYPDAELVIVEDGPPRLQRALPGDPRVRLVRAGGGHSIGALRNQGSQQARGEIIAQWDDDDWHGPQRLSRQVALILDGTVEMTALRDVPLFDIDRWQCWRWSPQLHARLLVRDVMGGTLVFRRQIWQRLAKYPDRSLAEDAALLDQAARRGARLQAIDADGLYVYIRHGRNSWQLDHGRSVHAEGWHQTAEPALRPADRDFYQRLSRRAPSGDPRLPLVSCIMPTNDRRRFVPLAIRYFLRQDYPNAELVIVDDGTDAVADLVPKHPAVRYHRLDGRRVLGAKRNLACELAAGEIIAHWDDDDWSAPGRLSTQVEALEASGAVLSGMNSLPFYDPAGRRAWRYEWPQSRRPWAAGTSLCYRRSLWERSPFAEVAAGEDARFVWRSAVTSIADVSGSNCLVALVHDRNTVAKSGRGAYWSSIPVDEVERLLGPDTGHYRADTISHGH